MQWHSITSVIILIEWSSSGTFPVFSCFVDVYTMNIDRCRMSYRNWKKLWSSYQKWVMPYRKTATVGLLRHVLWMDNSRRYQWDMATLDTKSSMKNHQSTINTQKLSYSKYSNNATCQHTDHATDKSNSIHTNQTKWQCFCAVKSLRSNFKKTFNNSQWKHITNNSESVLNYLAKINLKHCWLQIGMTLQHIKTQI